MRKWEWARVRASAREDGARKQWWGNKARGFDRLADLEHHFLVHAVVAILHLLAHCNPHPPYLRSQGRSGIGRSETRASYWKVHPPKW